MTRHLLGTDHVAGGSPFLQRRFAEPCLVGDVAAGVGDTAGSRLLELTPSGEAETRTEMKAALGGGSGRGSAEN